MSLELQTVLISSFTSLLFFGVYFAVVLPKQKPKELPVSISNWPKLLEELQCGETIPFVHLRYKGSVYSFYAVVKDGVPVIQLLDSVHATKS